MDETIRGPKHNLIVLPRQFHQLNFENLNFFLVCEIKSILCVNKSMVNHAKIVYRLCLTFCETSLLVKFSRIVFKNSENIAISCLTAVCLDA